MQQHHNLRHDFNNCYIAFPREHDQPRRVKFRDSGSCYDLTLAFATSAPAKMRHPTSRPIDDTPPALKESTVLTAPAQSAVTDRLAPAVSAGASQDALYRRPVFPRAQQRRHVQDVLVDRGFPPDTEVRSLMPLSEATIRERKRTLPLQRSNPVDRIPPPSGGCRRAFPSRRASREVPTAALAAFTAGISTVMDPQLTRRISDDSYVKRAWRYVFGIDRIFLATARLYPSLPPSFRQFAIDRRFTSLDTPAPYLSPASLFLAFVVYTFGDGQIYPYTKIRVWENQSPGIKGKNFDWDGFGPHSTGQSGGNTHLDAGEPGDPFSDPLQHPGPSACQGISRSVDHPRYDSDTHPYQTPGRPGRRAADVPPRMGSAPTRDAFSNMPYPSSPAAPLPSACRRSSRTTAPQDPVCAPQNGRQPTQREPVFGMTAFCLYTPADRPTKTPWVNACRVLSSRLWTFDESAPRESSLRARAISNEVQKEYGLQCAVPKPLAPGDFIGHFTGTVVTTSMANRCADTLSEVTDRCGGDVPSSYCTLLRRCDTPGWHLVDASRDDDHVPRWANNSLEIKRASTLQMTRFGAVFAAAGAGLRVLIHGVINHVCSSASLTLDFGYRVPIRSMPAADRVFPRSDGGVCPECSLDDPGDIPPPSLSDHTALSPSTSPHFSTLTATEDCQLGHATTDSNLVRACGHCCLHEDGPATPVRSPTQDSPTSPSVPTVTFTGGSPFSPEVTTAMREPKRRDTDQDFAIGPSTLDALAAFDKSASNDIRCFVPDLPPRALTTLPTLNDGRLACLAETAPAPPQLDSHVPRPASPLSDPLQTVIRLKEAQSMIRETQADAVVHGEASGSKFLASGKSLFFYGCLVRWFAKMQKSYSLPWADANHVGAVLAAKAAISLRELLADLDLPEPGGTVVRAAPKPTGDLALGPVAFEKPKRVLHSADYPTAPAGPTARVTSQAPPGTYFAQTNSEMQFAKVWLKGDKTRRASHTMAGLRCDVCGIGTRDSLCDHNGQCSAWICSNAMGCEGGSPHAYCTCWEERASVLDANLANCIRTRIQPPVAPVVQVPPRTTAVEQACSDGAAGVATCNGSVGDSAASAVATRAATPPRTTAPRPPGTSGA